MLLIASHAISAAQEVSAHNANTATKTFWFHSPEYPVTKNVAYLTIEGSIHDSAPFLETFLAIEKKAEGLLVVINSGGGSAGEAEVVYRELHKLAERMPVVVFVKNICASGAYLIACAGNHIVAPQSAMVGSIGTYMSVEKECIKQFQQKSGSPDGQQETTVSGDISYEIISANKKKTTTHPLSGELSDEEREELQEKAREMAEIFADIVAESRNLHNNREAWDDGDIFTGTKALELGLIDSNGGCSDALHELYTRLQLREKCHVIKGLEITHWSVGDE